MFTKNIELDPATVFPFGVDFQVLKCNAIETHAATEVKRRTFCFEPVVLIIQYGSFFTQLKNLKTEPCGMWRVFWKSQTIA